MAKKIAKWNGIVVAIVGILVAFLFLGSMDLTSFAMKKVQIELPGYGNRMVMEAVGSVCVLLLLYFFGYTKVLADKGVGFLRGFYIGGFMTGYCVYVVFAQILLQRMSQKGQLEPVLNILMFLITMFFIGFNEEVIFRGIILNLFLDKFGNSKKGILISVITSGVIFGSIHIINFFGGVSIGSVLVQVIEAALLGILFAEIYLLSGNIWIVIAMHALTDVASMMSSGIFGIGNETDAINKLSAINLIAIPIFLAPVLVLFRRKKLEQLVQRRCGCLVMATPEEAENTAIMSLVLGIISILLSCVFYGAPFGVVGLLGNYVARKDGNTGGIQTAGFVTSLIGTIFSAFMMLIMQMVVPYMDTSQMPAFWIGMNF